MFFFLLYTLDSPIIETSIEKPKPLNSACVNDDICQKMIAQSYCFEGTCTCIEGYQSFDDESCIESNITYFSHLMDLLYENDENCLEPQSIAVVVTSAKSLLGGKCQIEDDCQTSNAQCLDQICNCPQGSFPIDDWNCFNEQGRNLVESFFIYEIRISRSAESSLTTTSTFPTTNFNWWPWSPSTSSTFSPRPKTSYFRCLLNYQCLNFDANSHCKSGRCICNRGYRLDLSNGTPRCTANRITNDNDDDCD